MVLKSVEGTLTLTGVKIEIPVLEGENIEQATKRFLANKSIGYLIFNSITNYGEGAFNGVNCGVQKKG